MRSARPPHATTISSRNSRPRTVRHSASSARETCGSRPWWCAGSSNSMASTAMPPMSMPCSAVWTMPGIMRATGAGCSKPILRARTNRLRSGCSRRVPWPRCTAACPASDWN
jgi:hypothetical protein